MERVHKLAKMLDGMDDSFSNPRAQSSPKSVSVSSIDKEHDQSRLDRSNSSVVTSATSIQPTNYKPVNITEVDDSYLARRGTPARSLQVHQHTGASKSEQNLLIPVSPIPPRRASSSTSSRKAPSSIRRAASDSTGHATRDEFTRDLLELQPGSPSPDNVLQRAVNVAMAASPRLPVENQIVNNYRQSLDESRQVDSKSYITRYNNPTPHKTFTTPSFLQERPSLQERFREVSRPSFHQDISRATRPSDHEEYSAPSFEELRKHSYHHPQRPSFQHEPSKASIRQEPVENKELTQMASALGQLTEKCARQGQVIESLVDKNEQTTRLRASLEASQAYTLDIEGKLAGYQREMQAMREQIEMLKRGNATVPEPKLFEPSTRTYVPETVARTYIPDTALSLRTQYLPDQTRISETRIPETAQSARTQYIPLSEMKTVQSSARTLVPETRIPEQRPADDTPIRSRYQKVSDTVLTPHSYEDGPSRQYLLEALSRAEAEIASLKSQPEAPVVRPLTPAMMPDAEDPHIIPEKKLYNRLQLDKVDVLHTNEAANLLKNVMIQLEIPFDDLTCSIVELGNQHHSKELVLLREFAANVHGILYSGQGIEGDTSRICLEEMSLWISKLVRRGRRGNE